MRLTKLSIFSFYIVLLALYGCTTTNQALQPKQAYLDMVSRYNAFYNASEKMKGVFKLSEQYHKDKFDSVIPVYYYSDPKEFASYTSDLDDVVKRSTLAIQLHNASNWSDDHFLLIGISNYLKGDYDKASGSFKYITTEFKEGVDYVRVMKGLGKKVGKYSPAKKKVKKPEVMVVENKDGTKTLQKIDNRPSISIWMHTPARTEALIWLIKTYTRQGKFDQASAVVTYARADNLFYKNFDPELDLVEADLKVSKKDYAGAIPPLEKYLEAKKIRHKKRLKVRPLFVLAQCYSAIGNNVKATANYSEVLRSRPNYDMEFYAKIKMAKLGRGSAGNSIEMRSVLARMAGDGKYKEYWDQVYYELALLALSENNRNEARKFLHKSVDNSTTNDDQKANSFLKLAELDYEDEAFPSSKLYYDSTLAFMAKNDARHHDVDVRDKMLDNLVKQLGIITQEDSMQKLAQLPLAQREKIVRDAIAKKEKEEADKKAAADAAKQQGQLNNFQNTNPHNPANPQQNQANNNAGPSWYFYNTTARSAGYNEFVRKWGKRSLEEHWRRKNKSTVSTEDENSAATDSTNTKNDSTDAKKAPAGSLEEQLLAAIPTTPEKFAKSVDKIVDAYYTAGTIYKDGLESYRKAADMFETLNNHYPKHKLLLESYYNLYLIAMQQKQNDRAELYKNHILTEFPESVIAKVLRDPNYVNEAKSKEHAVDEYYQKAYNDYDHGDLDSAWYKCEMSDVLFKPNPLSAKFQLLEALVFSKQNRLQDYVQMLNKIINKSTDAAVKKTASDLLAMLNKSSLQQIDLSKNPAMKDSIIVAPFGKMDMGKSESSDTDMIKKLMEAREKAMKEGKIDTTHRQPVQPVTTTAKDTTNKPVVNNAEVKDTTKKATENVVQEDTTSIYQRSDNDVHFFIVYIKDATAIPHSALMSTMAKIDAYNSTQFSSKRLQSHQSIIDKKVKILTIKQFKNKDDVLPYFNSIKSQGQLFSDLKPDLYSITAISITNWDILTSAKDMDEYNKFFKRVYK